ncbi:MAG TPA: hypothetical protein VHV82_13710 [Sporichthyaceae bacterium]|jgi:hypothetical protein|nr:hypothetical protein [Sporichthyaceae bacterium]
MMDSTSVAAAVAVFLGCTASTLGLTLMWATANRRPVRAHASLTGRAAAPYWYSPTGLADERGIKTGQRF